MTATAGLAPIESTDVPAVARFMRINLNPRVPESAWSGALDVAWSETAPNRGYLLRDGAAVVGAYLAYYADRLIAGQTERFCNLGAWCVLDGYRPQGIRLLTSLLAQKDYHFTDLSPSGNVVELNRRLKFTELDTTTALVPNVPWSSRRGAAKISSDPEALAASLSGDEQRIYNDHRAAAAARHLLLASGNESCYVMFRKDTRKRVRAFASILYVSNDDLFRHSARALGAHLLTRHGAVATLVELRVANGAPVGGYILSRSRPKMFKSPTLDASQIDYLYSELTCLEW